MGKVQTFTATEFKAKCLDILDRVGRREWERVVVTKRGVPVAVVTASAPETFSIERLHGSMRGSVTIPPEFDLTAPILDEPLAADEGDLYR